MTINHLVVQMMADQASSAEGGALLVVSEIFPPAIGGSGELLDNIYGRLPNQRVVVLAHGDVDGEERRGALQILRRSVATDAWGALSVQGLVHYGALARLIRRVDASLVHCGRVLPEGLAALVASSWGGSPYLCWAHGEEVRYTSVSREFRILTRWVYRQAAAVVANSRNTAGMIEQLGIPKHKIEIVLPGVDAARFRPDIPCQELRQRLAPNGELVILSVGRLERRKGHDLVLRALKSSILRGLSLRYVIVGDGRERQPLQAMVSEAGLGDVVRFDGEVPSSGLPSYYAAADLFLMPNRVDGVDVEGFGIVFLEAAAAGRPTIGGSSGGVSEAVEDGVTGLLVSGTDAEELAQGDSSSRDLARVTPQDGHCRS